MKTKIYKYKLDFLETTNVFTGNFADILKVDFQGDDLCVWAQISEEVPLQCLSVYIIPTGITFTMEDKMIYLNTVQDGPYVWHIFYKLSYEI